MKAGIFKGTAMVLSAFLCVVAVTGLAADAKPSVVPLPLGAAANASRLDREAADGRGGWIDMGGNDLHVLPAGALDCSGIPFAIPADRGETDRTCIVLGRKGGASKAELAMPDGAVGPCLYLLHATADSARMNQVKIGVVRLRYAEGQPVVQSVRTKRDVLDWTLGSSCGNAVRGWTKYNDNMQVSLFVSKFPVDKTTPPAFIVQTEDDGCQVENSLAYYAALKRAGVKAEMHLFAKGGHGYGMRVRNLGIDSWPDLLSAWIKRYV